MTALVTKHLPLVAGAPDGIKKLRALILELAVRGKLVSQQACDEPAEKLVRRIHAEKTHLAINGVLRKPGPLATIDSDLVPYVLPTGWSWARWDSVALKIGDIDHKMPETAAEGVPFVSPRDFYPGNVVDFDRAKRVSVEDFKRLSAKIKAERGDLIYPRYGTIGENVLVNVDRDFLVSYSCAVIKVAHGFINPKYQFYFSLSDCARRQAKAAENKTTQANVGIKSIQEYLFPVPPLTEQHRIVAKVDELMALCDRLKADQADAEAAHAQLVQALLDSLTQATDFRASWQRLSEHFHTLFTTEASIDALKQAMLQLAVMGKLVPQDSADESPSMLLERIASEVAIETLSTGSKKSRTYAEVEPAERYVDTPSSWIWTRLGSQVLGSGAGWSPSCEARPRVNDEWGVLKVSAVSWGEFRPEENKALPANLEARPEHEVHAGDFLVSRANTAELVARSVVVESPPPRLMLSDKIVRFRLTTHCNRRYINLVNSSPFARSYYGAMAGGTSSSMKNVTREQILNLPVPLPPLAEQHRIVAKVDELMALCDQLKAQLSEARQQYAQLATALVEQALA